MREQPMRGSDQQQGRPIIPKYVEAKRVVQAVILGEMQERDIPVEQWNLFGEMLTTMYEETDQSGVEFRSLFEGITVENMETPLIRERIREIEKFVVARMRH